MKDNIRIVLVNPSHPGNIGATARAMKTMELQHLCLVNPKDFPHATATAMAAGADDILSNATICSNLTTALTKTKIIIGTSARPRALQLPTLNPRQAAELITTESKTNNIAILFGRENNGLTNEELDLCNYHLYVPTNPKFSSLNIAAAVQLICYEIKMAQTITDRPFSPSTELATMDDVQNFYQHLQQTLIDIDFLKLANQHSPMAKLKLIFNRALLEKSEVSMLRGILTTINAALKKK